MSASRCPLGGAAGASALSYIIPLCRKLSKDGGAEFQVRIFQFPFFKESSKASPRMLDFRIRDVARRDFSFSRRCANYSVDKFNEVARAHLRSVHEIVKRFLLSTVVFVKHTEEALLTGITLCSLQFRDARVQELKQFILIPFNANM